MKKLLSLLSAAALSFALVPKLHASALTGGRLMDTTEALQVFGSSFQVTYYNGTEYVSTTATYTNGTRTLQDDVGQYPAGAACLQYTAPVVNLSHNPEYITLDLRPQYSIFNTSQLHTAIMIYCTSSAAVPPYQSPDWRWTVNGNETVFHGVLDSNNNISTVTVASDVCIYVPVSISQQNTFSANSVRVTVIAPVSVYNGNLYFYLAPPYLSNDAFGEFGLGSSGSTTTTSSSGSGGQSVDMSETNGILSAIQNGISGLAQSILDGLVALFVPREGFFDNLLAQLRARFSWYVSIENAFNAIRESFSGSDFNTPPNVTVDGDNRTFFGAPIGSFSAPALVLDWFTAHRAAARTVQSAFMWLFFLLRIYKHLPAIIAGNEGALDESGGDE